MDNNNQLPTILILISDQNDNTKHCGAPSSLPVVCFVAPTTCLFYGDDMKAICNNLQKTWWEGNQSEADEKKKRNLRDDHIVC